MKKLSTLAFILASCLVSAQTVTIEEMSTMSGDISGGVFDYNTAIVIGDWGDAEFKIMNDSDSPFFMGFHVELLSLGNNWGNHALVWAHEDDQFGGLGFAGSYIDNGFSFPTTEYVQLLPGESAFLNPSWLVEGGGCEIYNYVITNEGVSIDSLKVNFCNSVLSVQDELKERTMLFPNPASTIVEVRNVKNGNYSVVNLTGQVVLEGEITMGSAVFNVEELQNGIYMFLIENSEDGIQSTKFIVRH